MIHELRRTEGFITVSLMYLADKVSLLKYSTKCTTTSLLLTQVIFVVTTSHVFSRSMVLSSSDDFAIEK